MNLEELKHIHANIDSQMGPVDGVSQAEFDESMEVIKIVCIESRARGFFSLLHDFPSAIL